MKRRLMLAISVFTVMVAAAACGGGSSSSGGDSGSGGSTSAGAIQDGGSINIARTQESLGMDNINVFDNESIWIFQQMLETLYTVSPDGKSVIPWLATSYDLSPDQLTYTFHLRPNVKFHNGQPMTSADVKFSLDTARDPNTGWGYIDAAIKSVSAPDPMTVVVKTKYKWAPLIADIALFNNAVLPKDYAGESQKEFYTHPIGTGPFMWGHWTHGQEIVLKRNPHYWQKGKPYLDQIAFLTVTDTNTRQLQLQGGQEQIDQFPDWQTVNTLKSTPGITMSLFPSTRTDYTMMNERYAPLADVHVRRAISYAIDRNAIIKSVLFGHGQPANSFMPPQVPFYDPHSPGLQYDLAQAKAEMAKSKFPNGFPVQMLVGAGVADEKSIAQIYQQELAKIGIKVTLKPVDPSVEFSDEQEFKYQLGLSYWTMDIADPDELVTFAVDPGAGAKSFYTDYNNADVINWTHTAEKTFSASGRQELYSKIQAQAAKDAFMVFMYYSPYRYAYTDKLHGFFVYPTGNFHMEDVWLSH